jgi:hypothetical protein
MYMQQQQQKQQLQQGSSPSPGGGGMGTLQRELSGYEGKSLAVSEMIRKWVVCRFVCLCLWVDLLTTSVRPKVVSAEPFGPKPNIRQGQPKPKVKKVSFKKKSEIFLKIGDKLSYSPDILSEFSSLFIVCQHVINHA